MKWFQNRRKKLQDQKRRLNRVFNNQDNSIVDALITSQLINGNEIPPETTKEYPSESTPSYEGGGGQFGGGGASSSYDTSDSSSGGDSGGGCDGGGGGGD